jgi:hypothetical protein
MLADSYSPTPKELAISVLCIATMMSRLSLFKTWTHLKAAPREHWAWFDFDAGVRCKGRTTPMPKERVGVSWGEIVTALAVMGIITFLLLL